MSTTTKARERPILFSDEMVRALLTGRKTQTRRIVKGEWTYDGETGVGASWEPPTCPFGVVGDRLWVRESAAINDNTRESDEGRPGPGHWRAEVHYQADGVMIPAWVHIEHWRARYENNRLRKTPSIHMPRWASRILLEITDVRVERLKDISEADAMAEGVSGIAGTLDGQAYDNFVRDACRCSHAFDIPDGTSSCRGTFGALWIRINSRDSWAANPYVWALTFRMLKP